MDIDFRNFEGRATESNPNNPLGLSFLSLKSLKDDVTLGGGRELC